MRKLALISALVVLAAAPACKKPDPNKFETHVAKMQDAGSRNAGFAGLERLVKSAVTSKNSEARIKEFAEQVVPLLAELYDSAPEWQEKTLLMLRDVGHPSGSAVWNKALLIDGSADARKKSLLALDGIKKAEAAGSVERVVEELTKLIANPKNDKGKAEGELRLEMVRALGAIGDANAVSILITALEQTKESQPVAVHRAAADALGAIGDPSAVDALLTAQYRVPDAATTSNIAKRAERALTAIGEPAVDGVLKMLRGEHEEVNKLAAQHQVDIDNVKSSAAAIAGALGSPKATTELIAFMPKDGCEGSDADGDPVSAGNVRAVVANALGLIGDPAAAEPLCACVNATHNPGDMFPIAEALGRIGGDKAVECLTEVVKNGEYDQDAITSSDFRYEIRWEAARFALQAASPEQLPAVKAAIEGNTDAKVKENVAQWAAGIKLVEECKADKACYLKTLKDQNGDWFAREKAAYELARLAKGDNAVATEISKAFKVRNPDARTSMALLAARVSGEKCPECVEAFNSILKAEKGSMDKSMQLPVLTARTTIAKLGGGEEE